MCILSEKPHNVNAFKTSSLLILSAFSASTRRGASSRALTGRTPEVPVKSGSNLASIEPESSPVRGGARSGAEPGPGRSPACCSLEPPITAVWEPEQLFLVVQNEQTVRRGCSVDPVSCILSIHSLSAHCGGATYPGSDTMGTLRGCSGDPPGTLRGCSGDASGRPRRG